MNKASFHHRNNRDNSWDSTCPRCSLIVARTTHEHQLAHFETIHLCNPSVFRRPYLDFQVFFQRPLQTGSDR